MKLEELKSGEDYNKEILKLIQKLNISEENVELYKTGFHDMKRERDELNKDVEQYKLEINNLKKSVSDYKNLAEWHVANWYEYKALQHESRTLKSENKALRLQADEYFEMWQEAIKK